MILYSFPSSPFGCKVKAVILACNLEDTVEIEEFHPWSSDSDFRALNPLGKIPVLRTDDDIIFDSKVICEYLMEKSHMTESLMPDRIESLKMQALTDGIAEAVANIRYELFFRPSHLRCMDWCKRQRMAVMNGLEYLNKSNLNIELRFKNLCMSTLLSYLEIRCTNENFAEDFQDLYNWYDKFMKCYPFLESAKAKDKMPPENICKLER